MTTKPETVEQCASCPWRVDCVPERDIPNGYSTELHEGLRRTIGGGLESLFGGGTLRVMGCHYSQPGEKRYCAGWLANQLGPGNNLGLRLAAMTGRVPIPEVVGPQHETFDDTLPRKKRRRKTSRP